MSYIKKEEYISRFGEEAWQEFISKKYEQYQKRNKKNPPPLPSNAVKATLYNYTYYVTEDGKHFYDAKGKERKIQNNSHRQNRKYIKLNQKTVFFNLIMVNAFPEICGTWFEGCEIHHIDGNPENDSASNLQVLTPKEHCNLHNGLIVKYSMEGEKLGEYTTSYEAAKSINNKRTPAAIRECLCGNSNTCGGYRWNREF